VSEFTTVTNDGVPTVHGSAASAGRPLDEHAEGAEVSITHSDTHHVEVMALLRGGPAAGKQIQVPRIAGTFPLFLGINGGNYVRDKGSRDRAVYNWWPAGASSPAGDPNARSGTR
jgi:hypothetical protein